MVKETANMLAFVSAIMEKGIYKLISMLFQRQKNNIK
jgi:hypothetical protein